MIYRDGTVGTAGRAVFTNHYQLPLQMLIVQMLIVVVSVCAQRNGINNIVVDNGQERNQIR